MRKMLTTLLFMVSVAPLLAQPGNWAMQRLKPTQSTRVLVDQLANQYYLYKSEVEMISQANGQTFRYSNKLHGEISHLDVTNPMKILVHYRDQLRIVFLDNRLGVIGDPLNLMEMGYDQVTLAATSHSNGIWLYDPLAYQLIRLDDKLQEERRSQNLSRTVGKDLDPNFIVEVNNKVYLNDPKRGIMEFDIFGTYLKTYPVLELERFSVARSAIYYQREGIIKRLDLLNLNEKNVNVDTKGLLDFAISTNVLVVLKEKSAYIYKNRAD